MDNYIVKIRDERYGDDILIVSVPKGTPRDEVFKTFVLAEKYAKFENLTKKQCGEYYEELNIYSELCEDMRFAYFIEKVKQWEVEDGNVDYEF